MNNFTHIPVLLKEAIEGLKIETGKKYIDATLGGGGHTLEILKRGGIILGIDQDNEALEYVAKTLKPEVENQKLALAKGNFNEIEQLAIGKGFTKVDGILLDIGVSSYQLDTPDRGFSIQKDGRLDMRMDQQQTLSAYEVINTYSIDRLIEIFYKYGEEHNARKAAIAIAEARKKKEIETTGELVRLLEKVPHKNEAINPATRVFQAVRIEVNDELGALKTGLVQGINLLAPKGRMVVISFHSLEDRIVKQTFAKFAKDKSGIIITKKPITADFAEIRRNKRSRSAKMRIIEKI